LIPDQESSVKNWFAVYTRSNFEKTVSAELSRKGLDVYLPAFRQVHQWRDRKRTIDVPVFPGYVFASMCDDEASRMKVVRTIGVVRILGQSGRLEPVPDEEIGSIQRLLKSDVPFLAYPFLREGAWVRVKRGPLQDLEGILVRVKSQNRLVLSIYLLSQSVATEIDVSDVEVVSEPAQHRRRRQASVKPNS
jgi:transcription antitermination factor NusG